MRDRKLTVILLAILISLIAIVIGWYIGRRPTPEVPVEVDVPALEPVPEGTGVRVDLYFPGDDMKLYPEPRDVPDESDPTLRLERILQELKIGPQRVELYAPLPEETTVGWIHINEQGIAYIDLVHQGEGGRLAWGSGHEMLSLYSLVNTVLLNIPEIESIIFLNNGQQRPSFAGHLDTSRPLVINNDLIAELES